MGDVSIIVSYQNKYNVTFNESLEIPLNYIICTNSTMYQNENGVVVVDTQPSTGSLDISTNSITYTHTGSTLVDDTFSYHIRYDDTQGVSGDSDIIQQTICIDSIPISIDISSQQQYTIESNITTNIPIDYTINGPNVVDASATIVIQDQPLHGTLTVNKPNFVYTHNNLSAGFDSFTYYVEYDYPETVDILDASSSLATVSLTINTLPIHSLTPLYTKIFTGFNRTIQINKIYESYKYVYKLKETSSSLNYINSKHSSIALLTIDNSQTSTVPISIRPVYYGSEVVTLYVFLVPIDMNENAITDSYLNNLNSNYKTTQDLNITHINTRIKKQPVFNSYSTKRTLHTSNRLCYAALQVFNDFLELGLEVDENGDELIENINKKTELLLRSMDLLKMSLQSYKYNQDTLSLFKEVYQYGEEYRAYSSDLDKLMKSV